MKLPGCEILSTTARTWHRLRIFNARRRPNLSQASSVNDYIFLSSSATDRALLQRVFNGNGVHFHGHASGIPRVRLLLAADVARVERQVFWM